MPVLELCEALQLLKSCGRLAIFALKRCLVVLGGGTWNLEVVGEMEVEWI